MEERYKAVEVSGMTFIEKPDDCESIRPSLQGFGKRVQRKDPELEDSGPWHY